jgi:hypothetical protein
VQHIFPTPIRFSRVVQVVQPGLVMPNLVEAAQLNSAYRCANSRPHTCPAQDIADARSERAIKPASAERYAKQHMQVRRESRMNAPVDDAAEKIAKEFNG